MKKILTLLYVFMFLFASLAQSETPLEEFIDIKKLQPSPIASFTEKVADVVTSFGEVVMQDERISDIRNFDKQGNQTERYHYALDSSYTSNGSLEYKAVYQNNAQGQPIKILAYDPQDNLAITVEYKYDEQGNQIEETSYNSENKLTAKSTYKYDEYSNQVEQSEYDSNGSLDRVKKYKYDDQDNQIEWTIYNSDGSLETFITFDYDEQGNQIEEVGYHPDGSILVKIENIYNSQGHWIQRSNTQAGSNTSMISKYKYDEKGNQIEEYFYFGEHLSSIKKCEYEYDSYSNWTQRICAFYKEQFGELRPDYSTLENEATIRIIEYHE